MVNDIRDRIEQLCAGAVEKDRGENLHEWENEQETDERMICPYCGDSISDPWEYEEGEDEIECPNCDRTFEVEISSVRTYRTRRRIEDMPDGWNGEEL